VLTRAHASPSAPWFILPRNNALNRRDAITAPAPGLLACTGNAALRRNGMPGNKFHRIEYLAMRAEYRLASRQTSGFN
jgi:hypothetical protein